MDIRFEDRRAIFREQMKQPDSKNIHLVLDNTEKDEIFDPNIEAKEIEREQLIEFAKMIKGTPYENLIAFKDPQVQELIDFILSIIIAENKRINGADSFPLQIYSRYKSNESVGKKVKEYSNREDKIGKQITDYLGIRVLPESEHSIFFSDGDVKLQEMIDKREKTRMFIAKQYKDLSEFPNMTYEEYCTKCKNILDELITIFRKCRKQKRTL